VFENRLRIDHYNSQTIFFTVCIVQQTHEFNYLGRNVSYVNNDIMYIISYIYLKACTTFVNIYVNVQMELDTYLKQVIYKHC